MNELGSMNAAQGFSAVPRTQIAALQSSRIREIANAAMGRTDIAAFWFGESDQTTPAYIRQAAIASLEAGETFYTQNLGRPLLREAIANYVSRLHGAAVSPERIVVTSSGVSALMLAAQMILSPGDRAVVVTPIWPNIAEIPKILGAEVARVPLVITEGRWDLDVERLLAALTPQTKMLLLNSPNNPTGWTIGSEAQKAVFDHCRKHGIWLVTDDVYERLIYRGNAAAAPSVLPVAGADDRLISVNSFSKAWAMTGWRMGWMVVPEALAPELAKVIEYNTSCAPEFVQRGAIAALDPEKGEAVVADIKGKLETSRNLLVSGLRALDRVDVPVADGAMYAFFRIDGYPDSMALARGLIEKVGLGLAPGAAFGDEGEGWLRWCFAASEDKIADGLDRLRRFLVR